MNEHNLLFVNGNVYPLDAQNVIETGVYVREGRIVEVGDGKQLLKKYAGASTQVIDVQGNMVIPGLVDSHMHLAAYGLMLQALDFSQCTDAEQMKHMLLEAIEKTPPGEWVVGFGWNENNFADRKIFYREELDVLTQHHPLLLKRICGHASVVNSKALEVAGIDEQVEDPVGGKFERDEKGAINGMLLDQAGEMIQRYIPDVSADQLKNALRGGVQEAWRYGMTGCHTEDVRDIGSFKRTLQLYTEVLQQEDRPFRIHELTYHEYIDEMRQVDLGRRSQNPYFEAGAMKIFADGAFGGRSAWLKEPYADDPTTHGVPMHTPEQLQALVQKARTYQLPVAVHTIGDQALEQTLDALEAYPNQSVLPDRIIHAQVVNPDLLQRMQRLPIVVDIQPRFVASDFPWVMERLGPDRLPFSYSWRTLIEAGLHCAGGSDAPIEPLNPLYGIHAAVTRNRTDEESHAGYLPEQRLTLEQALRLFTNGSAYAEHKQDVKGSITPGKYADLTVLDQDLFQLPPDEWLQTKTTMTIVGGRVVYAS